MGSHPSAGGGILPMNETDNQADEFRRAAVQPRPGLVREFWEFLKHNKKWWLMPILIVILLIGLLVVLAGSGVGTFMYTVF